MNTPLRTLIVEDDLDCIEILKRSLELHKAKIQDPPLVISSYQDAINLFKDADTSFELSILDYYLDNNHDAGDLLAEVGHERFGIIAFTSIDERAEKIASVITSLILPKPPLPPVVRTFIDKLKDFIQPPVQKDNVYLSIFLNRGGEMDHKVLRIDHIVLIVGLDTSSAIHYDENNEPKKFIVTDSLSELTPLLDSNFIIRISKKHMVNIEYIDGYKKAKKGELHLKGVGKPLGPIPYSNFYTDALRKKGLLIFK